MSDSDYEDEPLAIGIDLGTTYSCVAAVVNDEVRIIHNENGDRITPSWVAFTPTERYVGKYGKEHILLDPENTVYDSKRLIGRSFADKNVQADIASWPFHVVEFEDRIKIKIRDNKGTRLLFPEEISSMILQKMREIAETMIGEGDIIRDAVITVPAYFSNRQLEATRAAAKIAGINVLQLLHEPTAAALTYSLDKTKVNKNILVYDLGGGTFDVSILKITPEGIEVQAVTGNNHLGGEDFDKAMVKHFINEFKEKHGVDLSDNKKAKHRLKDHCEKAKRTLSNKKEALVQIDKLYEDIHLESSINRATFEHMNLAQFQSTMDHVKQALKDAKLQKEDIDEIVLVGGSTRIPKIQSLIKEYFKVERLNKSVNPDEAVAHGAALLAKDLLDKKLKKEAGASGGTLFTDVTPLSLGVGTIGELMSVIVPRNSKIPSSFTRIYTNAEENQTDVTIEIYEGEREELDNCEMLERFNLTIPAAPAKTLQIYVNFTMDNSGILHVSATEKSTAKAKEITVRKDKGKRSEEEIEKMITTADLYKQEDARKRKVVNATNDLQELVHKIERGARRPDVIENTDDSVLGEIKALCQSTLTWIKINKDASLEDVHQKQIELERKCDPILTRMKIAEGRT